MAPYALTECEAKFREYLQKFTLQKPDEILPDWEGEFFQTSGIDQAVHIRLNMDHPVWKRNDLAWWGLKIVADVFVREYLMLQASEDLIQLTTHLAEEQLLTEVKAQTGGLDLELITELSAEKYEGNESKAFKILLVPYPLEPKRIRKITLFDEQMRYQLRYENIHALRKQLNMARDACLVVCYTADSGSDMKDFYTVGLCKSELMSFFPSIHFMRHMSWSFCLPSMSDARIPEAKLRLRYARGRLLLPDFNLEEVERRKIQRALGSEVEEKQVNYLLGLLQSAKRQEEGTILIISDKEIIKAECNRLCSGKNRGIILRKPRPLRGKNSLLLQLSAIDGALLVDLEANCWACGVILDGRAAVRGNTSRGARFNSANNYIDVLREEYPQKPLLAVVVSEDGMVDLLPDVEKI